MIVRIVKMEFHEAKKADFLALFSENKARIRDFPGCHYLELWEDVNDPGVFFTYSHWDSEDALNAYRQSTLFEHVWLQTKALFRNKPQAWSVNQVFKLP